MSETGSHPAGDLKMKAPGWPHWTKVIVQNNVTNHKWLVFELCFVFQWVVRGLVDKGMMPMIAG